MKVVKNRELLQEKNDSSRGENRTVFALPCGESRRPPSVTSGSSHLNFVYLEGSEQPETLAAVGQFTSEARDLRCFGLQPCTVGNRPDQPFTFNLSTPAGGMLRTSSKSSFVKILKPTVQDAYIVTPSATGVATAPRLPKASRNGLATYSKNMCGFDLVG